jgi:uncharacterized protein
MVDRVQVTPAAAAVIARLQAVHGDLLFHQSGGCCDGSSPMCYPRAEFRVGAQDVYLGSIAATPFYIGAAQFEYWEHTQLIIDVVPGRGGGFSLEAPEGVRFLTRSRVFGDDEAAQLAAAGPPPRGDVAQVAGQGA